MMDHGSPPPMWHGSILKKFMSLIEHN